MSDQLATVAAVMRYGMTWKEVVQVVQVSTRSGEDIGTCIDNILRLRPVVDIRHLFVGSIRSETMRANLRSTLQLDRDMLMSKVLCRLVGTKYDARGRLSDREFTILTDHDLLRLLDMSADALEEAVNSILKSVGPET